MAKIYANLIKLGLKTLEDVPEKIKNDVLAVLRDYVIESLITEEQYKEITGEDY